MDAEWGIFAFTPVWWLILWKDSRESLRITQANSKEPSERNVNGTQ